MLWFLSSQEMKPEFFPPSHPEVRFISGYKFSSIGKQVVLHNYYVNSFVKFLWTCIKILSFLHPLSVISFLERNFLRECHDFGKSRFHVHNYWKSIQRYSYYLCNSKLLQLPNLKLLIYKVCWDTFIILANLKKLIKQPRFMYSVGVRFNGPY